MATELNGIGFKSQKSLYALGDPTLPTMELQTLREIFNKFELTKNEETNTDSCNSL